MFTPQLFPASDRRDDDRRVRDAEATGVPAGWPMGSAARPLDELRPTIDSLVARRILDRLLAAAGMPVPDSPADDAALRAIGARLRAEGHERGAVRPVLDSALPLAPDCIAGCLAVASPEFAAWLRALARAARDDLVDALAAGHR